jgi:hypothetical protein
VSAELEDEEYRPRADDHLVEPFFAGLGQDGGGRELRADVRRGCGAAALLVLAVAVVLLAA